jgi:hypothetical protein
VRDDLLVDLVAVSMTPSTISRGSHEASRAGSAAARFASAARVTASSSPRTSDW